MSDLWTTRFNLDQQLCPFPRVPVVISRFFCVCVMVDLMKIKYHLFIIYVVENILIFLAFLVTQWVMGIRSLFKISQQKATTATKDMKKGGKWEKEKKKGKKNKGGTELFLSDQLMFSLQWRKQVKDEVPSSHEHPWGGGWRREWEGRNWCGTTTDMSPKPFAVI